MEEEIKKLIEDYVKQIEAKEPELTLFKKNIEDIKYNAHKKLSKVLADLDIKFNEYQIDEQEYLRLLTLEKNNILEKTQEDLDLLVKNLK